MEYSGVGFEEEVVGTKTGGEEEGGKEDYGFGDKHAERPG